MKKKFLLVIISTVISLGGHSAVNENQTADYNVVPLPREISFSKGGEFVITENTRIAYPEGNELLKKDAQFLRDYIADLTSLRLSVTTEKLKSGIILKLNPKVQNKEGYVLTVNKKGVSIEGSTAAGVFYGVQTLRKSIPVGKEIAAVTLPAVVIKDEPRFDYRGMMLDCARHFFPVKSVKQFIDLIAMHNMNVFHWHLTEDQGWRIEIKKYPELTEKGSVRTSTVLGHNAKVYDGTPYGGYYTQAEAREIVKYAADRYITVIPEIDMPGHMVAALTAIPDMGCTGGPYEVCRHWGVMDDVLCLGNEKTYEFCKDVLSEIMDIFPSKYIHLGGDETPQTRWKECPKCKKLMEREGLSAGKLQGYFTNRIEKFVNSKGRSIIGWDEILDGDINQSATIMSWRDTEPGAKAAKLGHDVIMSPTTYCYFDYYQTHNDKERWNEPLLIGGNLPIEKTYSLEPVPAGATPEVAAHIIGVQGNLWTEYIAYPSLVEYQVLPRMGALSEVQWTNGKRDFEAWKKRQSRMLDLYDLYGFTYATHLWPQRIPVANQDKK
ncbi:beta-N-acetylhexosaminidase [Prevotella sp. oral taxon 376]|uniref:beta-N-acetylhexosaminidase n=1 Tax=Prevotella sp. oral taxon 376 TaxID=712466 RepID=UPI000D1FBA82|nr:beta-N-acetylhexosaminidase [Prevotella sp. oral taxon 376]PTL34137.1 beta-N-acetylhexosaminidase [Prevotella sp. oral taxon 376]